MSYQVAFYEDNGLFASVIWMKKESGGFLIAPPEIGLLITYPNFQSLLNLSLRGLVTALNFGQSTLTATYNEVTATVNVSVDNEVLKSILIGPQNPVTANGTTVQLAATGVYSDLSK